MSFYAVRVGRRIGVFNTWDECCQLVKGFSGAQYKKFATADEAQSFISGTITACAGTASTAKTPTIKPPNKAGSAMYIGKRKRSADEEMHGSCSTLVAAAVSRSTPPPCKEPRAGSSYDPEGYAVVYTDGACHGNGKKQSAAGIGVYWGPAHASNVSERLEGRQTNNHAEIKAACKAIEQAKEMGIKKLCIRTDSKFLIDCMTKWVQGWKKKGWKTAAGATVKNQEELQVLDKLLEDGVTVKWEHVDAHVGIVGNECADALANEGARKPQL